MCLHCILITKTSAKVQILNHSQTIINFSYTQSYSGDGCSICLPNNSAEMYMRKIWILCMGKVVYKKPITTISQSLYLIP